jgi:2-methylcitrate dehydratase
MDKLVSSILDYCSDFKSRPKSIPSLHECRRRLIDVLGCGLSAFHEDATVISRKTASRYETNLKVSFPNVLGVDLNVAPEMAAFTNALAIRYFDGADTYPGGGGHPSDCWAGLIAVAQHADADVKSLFESVLIAYEVFYELFQASNLREKGIDNAFYVTVSTAVGASYLLGLSKESIAHAISFAIVPNVSLGVTRTGELSMWKAGASANAARNGVFAAMLAKDGMSAPALPFSGERGLFQLSDSFVMNFRKEIDKPRIFDAHMKTYLCDYHSQTAITVAKILHRKVSVCDIEKVIVSTYWFAWNEVASDPSKWRPKNRETADHSLPWIVAGVLMDGNFSENLFATQRFNDPILNDLCTRVVVKEDAQLTNQFPYRMPCRIDIFLKNGTVLTEAMDLPHGHPDFPMDDKTLADKFLMLTTQVMAINQAEDLLSHLWALNLTDSCRTLFRHHFVHRRLEI